MFTMQFIDDVQYITSPMSTKSSVKIVIKISAQFNGSGLTVIGNVRYSLYETLQRALKHCSSFLKTLKINHRILNQTQSYNYYLIIHPKVDI